MQINDWPPPPGTKAVIARIDGAWIEMRGEKLEPIFLDSHGCGCCSRSDPDPTHWIAVPTREDYQP